jgi:Flp pilus assembly protein TadG
MANRRSLRSEEGGQGTLEFVLLLPFTLFFIFAVIDFGLALDRSLILDHAAREAARYGSVGQSEADIRQRAIDQSQSLLTGAADPCPLAAADEACLEVTYNDGPDSNATAGEAGDAVTVRIRYRYRMLNPFLAWLPFSEIVLGACADGRIEVSPATASDKGWDCSSG